MYCPNCSQQQVSNEMRFCSRCGFPLDGVKELLAGGGTLVERERLSDQYFKAFRGARKGAKLMLAGFPLLFVAGVLTAIGDDFVFLFLLPVLCFIIGFARLLYATFIEGRTKANADGVTSGTRTYELPPASVDTLIPQRIETAEMTHPRSVTENTTRLFDEEAPSPRR